MESFDYKKVSDPQVFAENRLSAHSDHECYPGREFMEAGENPYRRSLNGLWRFSYAKNVTLAVPGFEAEDYDCSGWDRIRVPAHIQMEGYDAPAYANVPYPWDGREDILPGEIPEEFNPVASYVTYFDVPASWSGQRVRISFGGVESALILWCNGTYVGYSEDSFAPSEFDLTSYIREKNNKLAVQVFKWCSGSWCEDQDFFRFSGIFREVYLYTLPRVHVEDLRVRTRLAEGYQKAELELTLKVRGKGRVNAVLTDRDGRECAMAECAAEKGREVSEGAGENGREAPEGVNGDAGEGLWFTACTLQVEAPSLWSCENPYLYQLLLTVADEEGQVWEVIPQSVGFREIQIRDSLIFLNGKRLVFHGVNRHEFSSLTGRAVSYEETLQDIRTMKRNNINAIRTSHYPNVSFLYRLCDEYGIYVMDENNMESHGSWDAAMRGAISWDFQVPGDNLRFQDAMLDRIRSVYERDKNHASVLIWSIGNEAFGGRVPLEMSKLFRQLDDTRPVHYEGISMDPRYPETSDIYSRMYPPVEEIRSYLADHRDRPYVCCEYSHAMGNSCGALHKYTEYAYEEPLYQGGFIWDYIDQSITKRDRYGREFQAYGGDFGERPTEYNFSGNGICYGGGREASPKMQEVKFCYQFLRVRVEGMEAVIENRHLFTGTEAFRCVAKLKRDGHIQQTAELLTAVPPQETGRISLPFARPKVPGDYVIHVSFRLREDTPWAQAGYEVAFGEACQVVEGVTNLERGLREPNPAVPEFAGQGLFQMRTAQSERKLRVVRGSGNVGVKGEDFSVLFSNQKGGLVSYRYGGRELIEEIPMPNFWRAPVDNDCGNQMQQRYGQWKLASLYATAQRPQGVLAPEGCDWYQGCPTVTEYQDRVEAAFLYYLPTSPASACQVVYQVTPEGAIGVRLSYDPVEGLSDMPEFGMIFKFHGDLDRVVWYGNGPQETYEDRKTGASVGIYANRVEDNMAKYLVPQECGNKTEVRWGKVCDARGRGILLAAEHTMNFSALPYTPHELEYAKHPYELPQVHYTVVRVSDQQMGVGGDNSWGAPVHPEYLVDSGRRREFTFWFRGI